MAEVVTRSGGWRRHLAFGVASKISRRDRKKSLVIELPHAIEGDRAKEVYDDSKYDERLPHPRHRPASDREQHHEHHHVIEAEAVAELHPSIILIKQREQRDRQDRDPQRR